MTESGFTVYWLTHLFNEQKVPGSWEETQIALGLCDELGGGGWLALREWRNGVHSLCTFTMRQLREGRNLKRTITPENLKAQTQGRICNAHALGCTHIIPSPLAKDTHIYLQCYNKNGNLYFTPLLIHQSEYHWGSWLCHISCSPALFK